MTLLTVPLIQQRLLSIFPEGTEQRTYLTREIAARTVFVCLYAGAVEGEERWIRPNQICRFTNEQAAKRDAPSREKWFVASGKGGFKPAGTPWFADNSREQVRDETIREGFLPVRAMIERTGLPTTSSLGRYALERGFARLFDPALAPKAFDTLAEAWRANHLTKAALSRQQLVAGGAVAAKGGSMVVFPNGETRAMSAGPSSVISKAVIEKFAPRFLRAPHVLWLSESGNKVVARDDVMAARLGLKIDPAKALPDMILVDLGVEAGGQDMLVVFVEAVATDGPITRKRKDALTTIAVEAGFEPKQLAFLTAFLDRSSSQFKKAIVEIAWGSFVWLVAEPNHLISLHDGREVKLSALQ